MNARGIPTAAYQVRHLLSCTGEGGRGTPSLAGVPPYPELARGTPHPDLGPVTGVPLERTWDQWKYYGMEMGSSPPPPLRV